MKIYNLPKKVKLYLTAATLITGLTTMPVYANNDDMVNQSEPTNQIVEETMNNYEYSELFDLDKALNIINNSKENVQTFTSNNIIKNNKISESDLLTTIKNNNKESEKIKISDDLLNQIIDILIESINYELANNKQIDINNLDINLSNLKITEYKEFSYGYYNPDTNTLGINIATIEAMAKDSNVNELLERIVTHESKHIIQAGNTKELENSEYTKRFGFCKEYKDLDVNVLYPNWFFEGCAEQLTINEKKYDDSFTYQSNINILNSLKIATLLDNNKNLHDLENLSLQSDINELFKYFDCETDLQKKELLAMFYGYNIICQFNSGNTYGEFYEVYEKKYGHKMDYYEKMDYVVSLQNSCSQTLTKYFYNNLTKLIDENDNIGIKDVYQLISSYEDDLSYNLKLDLDIDNYKEFINNYTNIQNNFFEYLSQKWTIDINDLKMDFNKFHNNDEKNITIFDNNVNEFYNNMNKINKNYHIDAIASININYMNVK